ncbi:MAG: alpha/beta hydrolase [Gammaproteobacteria bacterium]|nr:alpha/beta hydrolase [Gammaproteobacteria bacterium]
MRFHQPLLIVFVSLLQLVSSCSHRAPSIPLDLQWESNQKQNDTLIIFLPGVRDNKQDFIDKGLFSRLQQSGIKVDMVAADLHLAYLENNTSVQRLHEDIILPARSNGYKKVWLVGISLGGLNALLYQKNRPEDICGLVLLSPYLGEKKISNEIIQAGGIVKWQPTKGEWFE